MDFTDFTFRVLLIFLPGIITTVLINRNTNTQDKSPVQFFMRAFIYGFISYYILMVIYFIINKIIYNIVSSTTLNYSGEIFQFKLKFFDIMNDPSAKMDFQETFFVSVVSVIIACIKSSYENTIIKMSVLSQDKKKPKLYERMMRAYHKFWVKRNVFSGQSHTTDVWRYLFTNLNNVITVRDWENNLAYIGTLRRCSSGHKNAELFLEGVTIADITGKMPTRKVNAVYLCKDNANSWDIEFMYMEPQEAINKFELDEYRVELEEYKKAIMEQQKQEFVKSVVSELDNGNNNTKPKRRIVKNQKVKTKEVKKN